MVLACLLFTTSCESVNSVYDTVVGAGEKLVPPPAFAAPSSSSRTKTKVSSIKVTAPPKGTVLLEGSTRYGIRNYTATYKLNENAADGFLGLANALFEMDDFSATRIEVAADYGFKVHTSSSFFCRKTWETTVTAAMRISIDVPAAPLKTETYSASAKDSLCAAAGVQLFPSSEAIATLMQTAFDKLAAEALSSR